MQIYVMISHAVRLIRQCSLWWHWSFPNSFIYLAWQVTSHPSWWTSFRWQCRILSHDVSRSWQHRRSASWPDFRLTKKAMKTWSGAPHFHLSICHRDLYVALSVQIHLIFRNADYTMEFADQFQFQQGAIWTIYPLSKNIERYAFQFQ